MGTQWMFLWFTFFLSLLIFWKISPFVWRPRSPFSHPKPLWRSYRCDVLHYTTAVYCRFCTVQLLCTGMYCIFMYYTVLRCDVLQVQYCHVLWCSVMYFRYCTGMYCTALQYTVQYLNVLYSTAMYCTVLQYIVQYYNVLYSSAMYCTVLQCTVLYYTELYYSVMYVSQSKRSASHVWHWWPRQVLVMVTQLQESRLC